MARDGRVRQTALRADPVERRFLDSDGSEVVRTVPGSFYEFISREIDPAFGEIDLSFDSNNATGIFAMTPGSVNKASALLDALTQTVGRANLLTDAGDLASYVSDGRGVTGVPLAVVRPANTEEVRRVMRQAAAAGVRLVPQGARTGLVAAGIAGAGADTLVLSLDRLAREPRIDPVNRTVEVDAGVRLSRLNEVAAEHGLFFPIDLGADPSIGGMVATNTGGARFLRYGDVRRNLMAIELVTAETQPRILQLGATLWKDNSALDLKQLFVGSSGSLGIVTAATLALAPKPAAMVTALVALDDADSAVKLLTVLEQSFGTLLTAFEGISGAALTAAFDHVKQLRDPFGGRRPDYSVLIELSAGAAFDADLLEERLGAVLMPWFDRGDIVDTAIDRGHDLWAIRHAVPEGLRASGHVVACDIALRRGDVMRFRKDLGARLEAIVPQLKLHDFGHIGGRRHALQHGLAAGRRSVRSAACRDRPLHDLHRRGGGIWRQLQRRAWYRTGQRQVVRTLRARPDPGPVRGFPASRCPDADWPGRIWTLTWISRGFMTDKIDALMAVYGRAPLAVSHGKGSWLYDVEGKAYLDCVAGIATDALGHANPKLIEALTRQANTLWHVSNIFRIPGQEQLAEKLTEATFADVVFFGNSGSEAVECALKTARRYHFANGAPERIDVIGFAGSFHGRTYAAINAAGNPSYVEGFGPRLPGYVQLTVDDEAGIAEAIARPTTAALIVEPIQGEGGARALTGEWLKRGARSVHRARRSPHL